MKDLPLKSLQNARCLDFPSVKENVFYRGGALDKISKKDAKSLRDQYGVKAIIDLRTEQEAATKPDKPIEGIAYYHCPLITMEEMGYASEKEGKRRVLKEHKLPDINAYYRHIVAKQRKGSFTKIFELLLSLDGGVYFHCTAGKDRTGVLSLAILHLLDVPMKDIEEDYLSTNLHPIVPFAYKVFARLMDKEFRKEFMEYFKAKLEYLESALDEIDILYGGLDGFYSELCGLDEAKIEAFRQKYLRKS